MGVLGIANSNLFTGLTSARATTQGPPKPGQDFCITSQYADFYSSGDGYNSEASALTDALANMNAWLAGGQAWIEVSVPITSLYPSCITINPPQGTTTPAEPMPIITRDTAGNYTYEFSFRQTIEICEIF